MSTADASRRFGHFRPRQGLRVNEILNRGKRWLFWFHIQVFLITALVVAIVLFRERIQGGDGNLLLYLGIPFLIVFWVGVAFWIAQIMTCCFLDSYQFIGLLRKEEQQVSPLFRLFPTWLLIPSWAEDLTLCMDERRNRLEIRSGLRVPQAVLHDVANPLQAIKGYLGFATTGLHDSSVPGEEVSAAIESAKTCADGLARYLSDLRDFVRGESARTFDLWATVHDMYPQDVSIIVDAAVASPLMVRGYHPIVVEAIRNIVKNARTHVPGREPIVITQDLRKFAPDVHDPDMGAVVFYDRGNRLTEEEAYFAFRADPVITASGANFGFGLSYFREVMKHQGGDLRFTYCDERTDLGTLGKGVLLTLPLADRPANPHRGRRTDSIEGQGGSST